MLLLHSRLRLLPSGCGAAGPEPRASSLSIQPGRGGPTQTLHLDPLGQSWVGEKAGNEGVRTQSRGCGHGGRGAGRGAHSLDLQAAMG